MKGITSLTIFCCTVIMGLFISLSVNKIINKDRVVHVKGLAEMEVEADRVIWPISFSETANTLAEIYSQIEGSKEKVIDFLEENGVDKSDISWTSPSVYDSQADRYGNEKMKFRYLATIVVTVNSDNVDLTRRLIDRQLELLKEGIALSGDGYQNRIDYSYTKLNDIKPQMIEQATKNAREAAQKFADDSGSKLDKIKTASQGLFSIVDRDNNTPYIKKVRVVTSITYGLKD